VPSFKVFKPQKHFPLVLSWHVMGTRLESVAGTVAIAEPGLRIIHIHSQAKRSTRKTVRLELFGCAVRHETCSKTPSRVSAIVELSPPALDGSVYSGGRSYPWTARLVHRICIARER
jgi:hypothetical protein